jgi:hypothetical protein
MSIFSLEGLDKQNKDLLQVICPSCQCVAGAGNCSLTFASVCRGCRRTAKKLAPSDLAVDSDCNGGNAKPNWLIK